MAISPQPSTSPEAAPKPRRRTRVPAAERRQQVIEAAREVVAHSGLHAASTAEIARRAGISHAYLFRLFENKDELMIAITRESLRSVGETMSAAGESARARGEDVGKAMGQTWTQLIADRTRLQLCLQIVGASESMPSVGAIAREEWERLIGTLEATLRVEPAEFRAFLADGMLLLIVSGLQAGDDEWVERLFGGPLPCGANQTPESSSN